MGLHARHLATLILPSFLIVKLTGSLFFLFDDSGKRIVQVRPVVVAVKAYHPFDNRG